MIISCPKDPRPHIKWHHIDGPVLCLRDGRMHWLTLWERLLLALNKTDALALERKHWGTEQSRVAADCPNERLVIQRYDLDKLEAIRLELHEIATHNPQIEQYMLTITSKLWPIIHKKREAV